jgi:hypothetical protein
VKAERPGKPTRRNSNDCERAQADQLEAQQAQLREQQQTRERAQADQRAAAERNALQARRLAAKEQLAAAQRDLDNAKTEQDRQAAQHRLAQAEETARRADAALEKDRTASNSGETRQREAEVARANARQEDAARLQRDRETSARAEAQARQRAAAAEKAKEDANALSAEQLTKRINKVVEADAKDPNGSTNHLKDSSAKSQQDTRASLESKKTQAAMNAHLYKSIQAAARELSTHPNIGQALGLLATHIPDGVSFTTNGQGNGGVKTVLHRYDTAKARLDSRDSAGLAHLAKTLHSIPKEVLNKIPGFGKGNSAYNASVALAVLNEAMKMHVDKNIGDPNVAKYKGYVDHVTRISQRGAGMALSDTMASYSEQSRTASRSSGPELGLQLRIAPPSGVPSKGSSSRR